MRDKLYFNIVYRGRYLKKVGWICKIIAALLINCLSKKHRNAEYWLIGAEDDRYENNVRAFSEFLIHHTDRKLIWVVNDTNAFSKYRLKSVKRGSIANYLLALNSLVCLYSHSDYDIAPGLFRVIKKRKQLLVYLDHGLAGLKKLGDHYFSNFKYDIMCCVSDYELNAKIKNGTQREKAYVTGFARYDYFERQKEAKDIQNILVMPTWRDWYINGNKDIRTTELYQNYKRFFRDDRVVHLIRDYSLNVCFILHPTFSNYFICDDRKIQDDFGGSIKVITKGNDMRKYIQESDMLISDYSGLIWDFMYMNKAVNMYWFDHNKYMCEVGLDIGKEKFAGILSENHNELVCLFDKQIRGESDLGVDTISKKFFCYFDQNNCKRIYSVIVGKINELSAV